MRKINLIEKFELFDEHWTPKVIGRVNDVEIRIAKLHGEFEWHSHANEDEMFLVVRGELVIKFRDRDVALTEGEALVIPRGVEHLPVARDECWVMLVEPSTTVNTGSNESDRTLADLESV